MRMLAALLLLAGCVPAPEVAGRALYGDFCASCHGVAGEGGVGPDLTRIAERRGGVFPRGEIVDHIDGYRRGGLMPGFGVALQEGDTVIVEGRRVPGRLAALAAYLEELQE